jgi:hypothetical protein
MWKQGAEYPILVFFITGLMSFLVVAYEELRKYHNPNVNGEIPGKCYRRILNVVGVGELFIALALIGVGWYSKSDLNLYSFAIVYGFVAVSSLWESAEIYEESKGKKVNHKRRAKIALRYAACIFIICLVFVGISWHYSH